MKKLFFVALAFLTLLTIAPQAEARDRRYHSRYDSGYSRHHHHHGGYHSSYGGRRYRSNYYSRRPVVYYRTAPVYYRSSYYDDGYCAPRYYSRSRYYSSRPRISFSFGF